MKQSKPAVLLKQYLAAQKTGKEIYFDIDEIENILNWLNISDRQAYYDEVLSFGIRLHPQNMELKVRKCRQYVANEEFDEALDMIDNMAESDNLDFELIRLECYLSLGQYTRVVDYVERLIGENSDDLEDIFEYLMPVINDLCIEEDACDFMKRGPLLFPDNTILKNELCVYLVSFEDLNKAIALCNELIDRDPYFVEYWYTLGKLHMKKNNYEKAIEAFDFALTCDDKDLELKAHKAYCFYMNRHYEKAIDVCMDLVNDNGYIYYCVSPIQAECYLELGKEEEAYELLKSRIDGLDAELENDVHNYVCFIQCCMRIGKKDVAERALNKALHFSPENISLLFLLAIKYKGEGNAGKLGSIIEKIVRLIDKVENELVNVDEDLFQTAQMFSLKNEFAEALKYYLKISETNPHSSLINRCIALSYLSLGDNVKFDEYYKKAFQHELIEFFDLICFAPEELFPHFTSAYVHPTNLVKEFFKDKALRN